MYFSYTIGFCTKDSGFILKIINLLTNKFLVIIFVYWLSTVLSIIRLAG